jgi:hypothetical protein
VRNDDYDRIMAMLVNQGGTVHVGLTKGKKQFKRSVALLVARAFLRPAEDARFDTPIHLDGDSRNNHVENLMWRPRWYAIRYQHQFTMAPQGFRVPIVETHTGEEFPTSWDAAIKYGLIDRDIMLAVINKTFVWPTYQFFKTIT